jgi:hypothetical protein
MWALLLGLVLAAATVAVAPGTASANPQCPQFTLEPCDDGDPGFPGDPTGPAGPPMEGGDPTINMGEMIPLPAPDQPTRMCANSRFNQSVFVIPEWRFAYAYDINVTICITGSVIEVLRPARAEPVPAVPADPRITFVNRGINPNQAAGVVTAELDVTFCPTGFCQLYIHRVTFVVFPWGGQIRVASSFQWIN